MTLGRPGRFGDPDALGILVLDRVRADLAGLPPPVHACDANATGFPEQLTRPRVAGQGPALGNPVLPSRSSPEGGRLRGSIPGDRRDDFGRRGPRHAGIIWVAPRWRPAPSSRWAPPNLPTWVTRGRPGRRTRRPPHRRRGRGGSPCCRPRESGGTPRGPRPGWRHAGGPPP